MTGISAAKNELKAEVLGEYESSMAELGGYTVSFATMPAGYPPGGAALFKGLPGDMCQCPHWGVLTSGTWRVTFDDGRVETITAGQAYYIPPGHLFEVLEKSETIDFSPTPELNELMKVMGKNLGALS